MRISSAVFLIGAMVAAQPALANDNIPPKVEVTTPGGINLPDGSFRYQVTDLSIGSLSLERLAIAPSPPPYSEYTFNGANMTNNFDFFVSPNFIKPVGAPYNVPKEYHPIAHLGGGASGMYLQNNPTGTTPSTLGALNLDGNAGTLSWTGTNYVYSDAEGVIYSFSASVPTGSAAGIPSQRVTSIAYPDGHVRTFSYDANNHLRLVSDSSGYAIVFDWTGSGTADAISAACGFDLSHDYVTATSTCSSAALKVSYAYTSGMLTSFTDVLGQITTYTWQGVSSGGALITCIKPPGYSACKVQNIQDGAGYGAISQQIMADGSNWYTSTDSSMVLSDPEAPTAGVTASATDPNGKTSNWTFAKSSPETVTDANGHITTYTFTGATINEIWIPPATNEGTMLLNATMPEGDQYLAEYSASAFNSVTKQTWKAKPGSGLADRVVLTSYALQCAPQYCAKVATKTDPKGNVTNNDYYSWGGIKSEMQPAPTTGTARPLKLYDYVQKYPYIKNSSGTLVAGPNQIWVPNSKTDCQTVAGSSTATCDSAAPITVTTYEYGATGVADNLLVRGKVVTTNTPSGAPTLRTCYGYDTQGRKIWETSPRGTTSASCS